MLEFLQSEPIAERRHWVIVLVDSTDGVTGKTGQTGQVYLSKNGGTPALSTNSIVEVDSTNMPGHYYITLTAGELDTLGFISLVKKTASTLAFHDRAIVSYNNPYTSAGGFTSSGSGGVSKEQASDLLKQFRKIVKEELAKLEPPEPDDDSEQLSKLDQILEVVSREEEKESFDYSPIFEAINATPPPIDYSGSLQGIMEGIATLGKLKAMDIDGFNKATKEFMSKMELATKDINGSLDEVTIIKTGFEELGKQMEEFKATLAEQGDMDKRFDAMNSAANNTQLESINKNITGLAVQLTKLNFNLKIQALK